MVTTVLLPAIRARFGAADGFAMFHVLERRFAWQARLTTALAGASGFWMTWRLELWDRFRDPSYWWMTAMVLVWAVFTLMLFVAEPLFLDRWLHRRAARAPEATYRAVQWLHVGLLVVSLITAAGAVAGSHGW